MNQPTLTGPTLAAEMMRLVRNALPAPHPIPKDRVPASGRYLLPAAASTARMVGDGPVGATRVAMRFDCDHYDLFLETDYGIGVL